MKKLLNQNSIPLGIIATLVSELLCAALVVLVILVTHPTFVEGARWFAAAFVPPLLLLRYYAKTREYPVTLKTVITTFFVTFIAFMWVMLKYKYISF